MFARANNSFVGRFGFELTKFLELLRLQFDRFHVEFDKAGLVAIFFFCLLDVIDMIKFA